MTKEEAIHVINQVRDIITKSPSWMEEATRVVNEAAEIAIKALEAQEWIPCSERLPGVGTYVLVSKKPLGFRSNLPNVCTAHRSCDPRSGKEEWIDMLFGKLDDDDVLAWMPLPEPYVDDIPNEYFESGGK